MRVVTTVIEPAAVRSLVTLADAKDQLGLPPSDSSKNSLLNRFLAEASATIASYCDRQFVVDRVLDTVFFDGCGDDTGRVRLSRQPVTAYFTLPTSADTVSGATVLPFDLALKVAQPAVPIAAIETPPAVDTPILRAVFPTAAVMPADLAGSVLTAGSAPTADMTFEIAINDLAFATATILSGQTEATFVGNETTALLGDVLTVTPLAGAAATDLLADPTLGMLAGYLVWGSPGIAAGVPGLVPFSYIVAPPAVDTPILRAVLDRDMRFPAKLARSVLMAGTAATADVVFDVALNGLVFGTATIYAGGGDAVLAGNETRGRAGDILTITPRQGTQSTDLLVDPTLGTISGYLVGVAANTPFPGQPVSGDGIDPVTTVTAVRDTDVTLSLPITSDIPAGSLITFGLSVYLIDSAGNNTPLKLDIDYRLDAAAGLIFRMHSAPIDRLVAIYSAGFDPVPDDIQAECLRLVAGLYHAQARDPLLKVREGPTYGREEFWIGQAPVAKALDRYMRIAV